jgi:hypothetical protein
MQDIQTNKIAKDKAKSVGNYFKDASSGNRSSEQYNTPEKNYLLIGFLISFFTFAIAIVLAQFVFDGAKVTIVPVKKELPINETFIVDKEQRTEIISTQTISSSEILALPKNAVKKVSKKATGEITIYNNFGPNTQKLVKGTRFADPSGKIFKIEESVIVPGKNGNTDGKIVAKVIADAEGENYNIPPSKFTIPGFKGSARYNGFYAESFAIMKGGSSGKTAEVSDLEMEKGKENLKENIKKTLLANLEKQTPEGFVFDKNLAIISFGTATFVSEDTTTASFSLQATGTALFLKKEILVKKIVEKTQNIDEASGNVSIQDASDFTISIIDPSEIEDIEKTIRFIVTGNAKVTFSPSKEKIISYLSGNPISKFSGMTNDIPFIESSKYIVRPFWSSNFPSNSSKINIEISE